MAKQLHKHPPVQQKKQTASSGDNTLTYLFRNAIIVIAFAFLFFAFDKLNEKQSQLPELYHEFSQLRQSGTNQLRLQEVYNQIIEIQNDTSYLKKLTRGYHWAIHDLAIKSVESIDEMKNKASKPLTREDKLAMRVGVWPLIDHINKTTPADAVIYLPTGDSSISNNGKWNYIYDPEWMEYFLYPRLCVTIGNEKAHPDLAKRVTHVLIIEGKGYDKLKYDVPVEQRQQEAVLPIDHPPLKNQN